MSDGAHGCRNHDAACRQTAGSHFVAPIAHGFNGGTGRLGQNLARDELNESVENRVFVGEMVIDRHGLNLQLGGEATHADCREALGVGNLHRGREYAVARQRCSR